MNPIPVKLYSDFICPYCFIGERVIEQLSAKFPIDIEWTGYEIHPEIPYGGMSLHSFGGDFMDGLWQRIAPLAESYGVKIDRPSVVANTHLALEGAEFARQAGKEALAKYRRAVFDAYFLEGKDIGDHGVLAEIAEKAGLDRAAFSKALDEGSFFDKVQDNREEALDNLVTGVPTTVIFGARIIGAQSPQVFEQAFERALEGKLAPAK